MENVGTVEKKRKTKRFSKPTIVFGDVHGLTYWKTIVDKNPDCRYIFLGDYLDPYEDIAPKQLIDNLKEIIKLKKERGDDVVLLMGNHDLHYLHLHIEPCWRFNPTIKKIANKLFSENAHLFTYAFQDGKRIFTHAGISEKWFFDDFGGDPNKNIAEQLNNPKHDQLPALYRWGFYRGGRGIGGIFWADIKELTDPLEGYHQYAGHNRVETIRKRINNSGEITFCDSLYNGNYLKLDFKK